MAEHPGWQTLVAREARAGPEFASFAVTAAPLLAMSRRGDGQAVLVLPGLGTSDASTAPLRWFIDRLGYRSYGWGLGSNRGFGRRVSDGLDDLLAAAHEHGPVSLIGWSLGGVHAIELARRRPDAVRSIVTLGSPLVGRRHPPPEIPTTSVYSRTDAIVGWRSSLLPKRALRENVEVRGSHLGLGHNPAVAVVVANRLAQQPETWQPFRRLDGPDPGCRPRDERDTALRRRPSAAPAESAHRGSTGAADSASTTMAVSPLGPLVGWAGPERVATRDPQKPDPAAA